MGRSYMAWAAKLVQRKYCSWRAQERAVRRGTPHNEKPAHRGESSPLAARERARSHKDYHSQKTAVQIMSSLLTRARQPSISQGSAGLVSSLFP